MTYEPINESNKEGWIGWLTEVAKDLDNKQQNPPTREILNTEEGDLANMKDMVGTLLATLTGNPVEIN